MIITNLSKTNYPNPLVLTIYSKISGTFLGETVFTFQCRHHESVYFGGMQL